MASKTISEQIADLEATREAKKNQMEETVQKSLDESRSMDTGEAEQFDTIDGEIKTIDADLVRLRKLERVLGANAAPAGDVSKAGANAPANDGRGVSNVQVKNTEKLEPGISFARAARCLALSKQHHMPVGDIAKSVYPSDDKLYQAVTAKSAVPAASTLSATWADNLILDSGASFGDFVEYLRPRTLVGQISDRLRRLPFDTPVLIQGTGGVGKWTKEGSNKPLTSWTYTKTKMEPLKVAAIAAATQEMLSRASAAADALLRDELARAVGAAIDTTFVSDDAAVTDTSPAGIRTGVSALTLTGGGTIAGIRCDIATMLKELAGDNLSVSGSFWVMPETVAIDLSLIANEVGNAAFPGIGPTGGTLAGLPVFVSSYVPTESDGPVVMLMKGDEIFLGDEGGVQVKMSDQASLVMDNAPSGNSTTPTAAQVVSMWQTNSVAFLVERFINFQKRRAQAVVWANVNWSSCSS